MSSNDAHQNHRHLPLEAHSSADRRCELAHGLLADAEADHVLGVIGQAAAGRRIGTLLSVWVPEQERYLIPAFQFQISATGKAKSKLLKVLATPSGSGWEQVEWSCSRHALLGGRCPIVVLTGDPERVQSVAETEAKVLPGDYW